MGFSLAVVSRGHSPGAVHGLLIAVVSLAVERSLQGMWASVAAVPGHWSSGSVVVHGLSCHMACGIFPDQGLSLCLLHLQVDSLPLNHQGSPWLAFFNSVF